jgi:glucan 1,3-beta-glucosidase
MKGLAPGSQNGFDNSGRYGAIDWTQGDTVTQTKNALNQIRDDHASHPAVAAIELLNEPMGTSSSIDTGTLKQFMMDGCEFDLSHRRPSGPNKLSLRGKSGKQ